MSTGHHDTRGDPGPTKMDQPLYGSKMLMGAQGHGVHLSCPVLKRSLFKQLCTKTINQQIQHADKTFRTAKKSHGSLSLNCFSIHHSILFSSSK